MTRLRLSIIGIILLAALVPSVIALLTVRSLLRTSLDPMLADRILEGTEAGLAASRRLLEIEKDRFARRIVAGERVDTLGAAAIAALDPRERSALESWTRMGLPTMAPRDSLRILLAPQRFPIGGEDRLVAYVVPPRTRDPVWITAPLPADLVRQAERITSAIRLEQSMRRERGSILGSLTAVFLVICGSILAVVVPLGLYLGSRLTRPLALLGGGIDRVASGDLATRLPEIGGTEARRLLRHFNEMAARLSQQREELIRLEKIAAWRQMARRLAHEVKNPLTPIQLAAQQIRDSYSGEDNDHRRLLEESVAIIEEEVQRLRALVSEFSNFSRPPEARMEATDAVGLAGEIEALYGTERVVVRTADPPGSARRGEEDRAAPILALCDHEQIHRVLVNLVDNALAAQSENGSDEPIEIAVGACRESDSRLVHAALVRIEVADRGPGVPLEERSRIFEPDVTTKSGGTGLGLAIVAATVEAHRGKIEVKDRPGGGAIFVMTLPAASEKTEG